MGTGLRYFGTTQAQDGSFRGTCLITHLHWDHTQGLPFFTPMLRPGAEMDVYGPVQDDERTVGDVFNATIRPPLFPIGLDQWPGTYRFHDVSDDEFMIGDVRVKSRPVPHVGATVGYRIEWNGISVAYLSDHQQPYDGSFRASDGAMELARDADLVIHDSQYTQDEFAQKFNWGHCTVDYAVWFAGHCHARKLALFHHDPSRSDDAIDNLGECAAKAGRLMGLDVIVAREGLTVELG